MPSWLSALASFLASLLKVPLTHLAAFFMGKREGRADQKARQHEAGDKAARRAGDARTEYERGGMRDEASRYHTDE